MKFDTEYIEKLAKIIADNELTEISMEDGEQAITIRKDLPEVISAGMPVAAPVQATPAPVSTESAQTAEPAKEEAPAEPEAPAPKPDDVVLLEEIRDLLKNQK